MGTGEPVRSENEETSSKPAPEHGPKEVTQKADFVPSCSKHGFDP